MKSNDIKIKQHVRPFHAFGLFLYLKKISEKQRFSDFVSGCGKRPGIWNEWGSFLWVIIMKFILGSPTVFQNTRYLLMNIHNFCQTWVSLLVYSFTYMNYIMPPVSFPLFHYYSEHQCVTNMNNVVGH